jgi:hypothetical protein
MGRVTLCLNDVPECEKHGNREYDEKRGYNGNREQS